MRPETVNGSLPARCAMKPAIVPPPSSRKWREMCGTCGRMRVTAIVSPRARPRPNMEPPMIPPFP